MRTGKAHSRRVALQLMAASGAIAALEAGGSVRTATAMTAEPFPSGVTLLVAGTASGPVDRWAEALVAVLADLLPPGTRVAVETAIGNDGVTGANQFATRAVPDGATALLVPGAAATAWLVGDPRVHFDTATWVPVMDGVTSGVVVGRVPVSGLGPDQSPRIAAAGPAGPELPALLALELLGTNFTPVFGLGEAARAREALVEGTVDVILLHGENVPERMRALTAQGMTPLFSLGSMDASGHRRRDPLLANVPYLDEISLRLLGHPLRGALVPAWSAAAAATTLGFALVLPQLTPPGLVGLWRRLSDQTAKAAAVRALAGAAAVRVETTPAANVSTAAVSADAATLLEVRRWLGSRFGWHPT
jgi:hypothetical protein